MNKHGWTYKKLGEVCDVEYGTRVVKKRDEGEIYPVYGGGGATFKMNRFNRENRVVISRFAMSPKCTRWVEGKFYLNDSGLTLKSNDKSLNQSFLDCCVLSLNDKIYLFGRGVAQKNLKVEDLINLVIPIPSKNEQETIVAELDEINETIELLKQQVADLDALAQSTFYTMFGDPVTNERGWEVKKLGELYKVTSSKRILQSEWQNKGVPFYKVADIVNLINEVPVAPLTYMRETTYEELKNQGQVPVCADILITSRGTLGQCYIIKNDDRFYFQDGMITWLSQKAESPLPIYVKSLFSVNNFRNNLIQKANSSTVAYLSITQIAKIPIPIPPLALQQEFAAKVEAIESAKAEINAQIAEMQTLLASRMDYYFD